MTAPGGTVDLSLPDYPTLAARAGVDPRAEARRVAGADPGAVTGAATAFARSGGDMDAAFTQSMGAADTLGRAFTNDGAPVLDRATHVGNLPPQFGDAGTRLSATSRRLGAVADDLSATMRETSGTVTGLDRDLAGMAASWRTRVAAAATEGGLIPKDAVPGLVAERDRVATEMAGRVGTAGRQVVDRIRTYEIVINDAVRLLADHGFVPPAQRDTPPPPPPPAPPGELDPAGLGTPLMAGYAADPVTTALGNFVETEADLVVTGLPAGLSFTRTYNSRSDRIGPFGPGWSSWASTRLVEQPWTADYEGPDGQRLRFPRTGAGFGRAVGIHALVERRGGDGSGLTLAWFGGRRWDFDAAGRIERTWSGPGTGVRFHYDDGRLVALVHERGRRADLEWAGDRIAAVRASDGRQTAFHYDDAGRLRGADGPAGLRRYALDAEGRVASVTDADGVVELVNAYDEHGRVLTQRSPFGRTVTFAYAPDGQTIVADDSAGPTNVYRHDEAGRLVALTDGHGATLHKRYDAWGNPVEITDRGGAVWFQEFDDRAHLVRRTTPSGATYTLEWDDADRVVAVTVAGAEAGTAVTRLAYEGAERTPSEIVDPEGGTTRQQVADGLVHAVTDQDGVAVRLGYDRDGLLVEAVDAAGGVARIARDAAGLPTTVTTPAGRRTELVHDERGRLVARRDPAGAVWRHEYTAAGRPAAVVDPTGARTETRHGPHGLPAELVDPLGAVTTHHYDDFGNLADLTESDGAKWVFRHDALSRLTAWTDPTGGTWWQDHDVDGRPTTSTDPTGVRVTTGYDPAGQVTRVDDGLVVTGYRHDELGRLVGETHADGTTRTLTYDRCGRLRTETGPDGGATRYTHSPAGRLLAVTAPSGRTERHLHDDRGRLVAQLDGNGHRWELHHDPDGLLVGRTSPAGLFETIERDPCGRVVRHRVPGRGTTTYGHDAAGRVVVVTDRAGRREFTLDAAGRVVAATDALGHTTRYAYDRSGNLATATDPLGASTRWAHDEVGRVVAVTDPLGRTTTLAHDAAGRLRERRDPTGALVRWSHDGSGRPAEIRAADDLVIAIERDALGRPVRVSETGAPPITLRWDAAGRLVERRAGDRAVGWSYDPDGLRTGLTHPDGTRTSYRRDGAGRVAGLHHPLLGHLDLQRDPDGRLLALTGRDVSARRSYTDGWLTGHAWGGRRTRLTRDDQGRVVTADTDGRGRLFGYDAAGQLVSAADADGERGYAYDAGGRLTAESGPDGPRDHTYDAAGQLTSSTGPDGRCAYRYDEAGRRVAAHGPRERRDYRWDAFGRLAGVDTDGDTGGDTTALRVDALGELAQVDDVALSWDTADPWGALVAVGGRAVVGVGQPWALAGADLTGVPDVGVLDVDRQHPAVAGGDPWGADPAAGAGVRVGHRGELVVDGLVWLRERAYDPATRAFLSPDPLPPVPGTAYAANPYHYAGNDPVDNVDPLGLRPVTDADAEGHHGGGLLSKIGHGVLDVVGLVPVVGEAADLANAGWYALEGDYTMAALSAAAAIPIAGTAAFAAKVAIKGGRLAGKGAAKAAIEGTTAAEKITARTAADGAGTVARRPDFVASANGITVPTSRSRLEAGFREAGFPSQATSSPGTQYTLPDGNLVRVMEPSGSAPLRASFTNHAGGPISPFTDKPVQPPPGLTKPERVDFVRQRTHVELGP